MVDWDGLENRCTLTGTVGSNPTLSARFFLPQIFSDSPAELRRHPIRSQSGHLAPLARAAYLSLMKNPLPLWLGAAGLIIWAGLSTATALAAPAANAPKPLGVFSSWTAATYGAGAHKACYAFTLSKLPKTTKTTPAMLTVTERGDSRDEISLAQGITYSKHAKVTLTVGKTDLKFFYKDSMAYALHKTPTIKAFLAGNAVKATASAPHAADVVDHFGLDGFSAAYKAIVKACPANPGAK